MATTNVTQRVLGRFGFLLIALVLFLATTPLAEHTSLAEGRFRVLFTVVLLIGVYTMSGRRSLIVAAVLALPAIVGNWIEVVAEVEGTAPFVYALSALFLGYVAAVVLAAVLREQQVTTDTVLGGICVYFLIGIVWILLYALVIEFDPGAILINGKPVSYEIAKGSSTLIYFSFVTLTTLGYGDVAPHSDVARMLAAGEAVVGQLFIAVMIARLVGMHISITSRANDEH
ncbi:MAG: potassium channel family protein [Myxococcota bacterium]|nr:potassium channel family protein [Myxococcota bacterium]